MLSFLENLVIWGGLSAVRLRFLKLHTPNERSIHPFPVPRSGRLAIIMGGWLGWTSIPSFPLVLFLYTSGLCFPGLMINLLNNDLVRHNLRRLKLEYQPNAKPELKIVEPENFAADS